MTSLEDELFSALVERDNRIVRRESQSLEFKEQFNLSGLADYFRDFAAFANNKGGLLVFGVTDTPRRAAGLSHKASESFDKIDPERVSGFLNDIFSSSISWEQAIVQKDGKTFGAFRVWEAEQKPIIARKDEGREGTIRNGDVYYRYGGRTQRILSAELEVMINSRIQQTNREWIEHVRNIGLDGPKNAIVAKSEALIRTSNDQSIVIDSDLAKKITLISGESKSSDTGAPAYRIVGDVVPVETVEVEKIVQENIFAQYPFSAKEVSRLIRKEFPDAREMEVWEEIKENELKGDETYTCFNFRNLRDKERYLESRIVSTTTPVLYNQAAVDLLMRVFQQKQGT